MGDDALQRRITAAIKFKFLSHGTLASRDLDDNMWEILSNPKGGYTWIFEQGDLAGKGHWDKNFRQQRLAPAADSPES